MGMRHLAGLVLLLSGGPLHSQDTARTRNLCWRAAPLPRCNRVTVTELAYTVPLATTMGPDNPYDGEWRDFQPAIRWNVGVMQNRDSLAAHGVVIGITAYVNRDADPTVEYRRRRWLRRRAFLDASGGYTMKQLVLEAGAARQSGHGLTAAIAVAPIDLIGVSARGDVVWSRKGSHGALSLGVQSGGIGGIGLTALGAGAIVAIMILLAGGT